MYFAVIAAAGLSALVLAARVGSQRRTPGDSHLALTQVAIAWWVLCYLGEHLDPRGGFAWFPFKFPAVAAIPPAWLLFALHQVDIRPARWFRWLVYAWPILMVPLMATNGWHHLMFTDVIQRRELVGVAGPLFNLHLWLSYAVFTAAELLLFADWWRRGALQSVLFGIGGLFPFLGNITYQAGFAIPAVARFVVYDSTLPGFVVSALFTGWAAVRYQMLDPSPVAREALFEWLPDLVFVLDDQQIVVDANQAALTLLGVHRRDVLGRPWTEVFPDPPWRDVPRPDDGAVERPWGRGDHDPRWFELQPRLLRRHGNRPVGTLIVGRDVTARRNTEEQLRAESRRDGLTGLSNRRYLDDESARLCRSREFPVAIFAFDLDGLKEVNDRDGHAAGDALLQAMAAFLVHFFRAGDRIIRLGGDEFLVVLPSTTAAEADRILQRLPEACRQFNEGTLRPVRFSAGVAMATDAADWTVAMALADERLYEAKRAARLATTHLADPR